ncbi:18760_t:CDS:2, partial [Gigaspora margarita]
MILLEVFFVVLPNESEEGKEGEEGLVSEFFITDKDFSQISAAKHVWKGIKIQLCLWHIKRAVETRLANNKKPQTINYN